VFEAHAGDIVALHWLEEHRILISGARDCDVKFWLFPEDITRFKQEDALPVIVPLTAEDLDLQREIAELNLASGAQSAAAASASSSASAGAAFSSQVATFAPKHESVTPTSVTRQ
jgi:hypothetical protein